MTDMNLVQSPARHCLGLAEAVIDLSAIRDNVRTIQQRLAPGTEVLAVVKADAFGHGAVQVARAAIEAGATWLGVARADEALRLRAAGLTVPILTWLYDATDLMWLSDVDVSVSTVAELHQVISAPTVRDVHLKLDTGLHRGGSSPDQWIERRIRRGDGVSYGHDHVAPRDTTIALIPLGYADGIPRVAEPEAQKPRLDFAREVCTNCRALELSRDRSCLSCDRQHCFDLQ